MLLPESVDLTWADGMGKREWNPNEHAHIGGSITRRKGGHRRQPPASDAHWSSNDEADRAPKRSTPETPREASCASGWRVSGLVRVIGSTMGMASSSSNASAVKGA
jgi:hypothetical protein